MKKTFLAILVILSSTWGSANESISNLPNREALTCYDQITGEQYNYQKAEGQYFAVVTKGQNRSNVLYLFFTGFNFDGAFQELSFQTRSNRLPAQPNADYWAQKTKNVQLLSQTGVMTILVLFDNQLYQDSQGNKLLVCH